jgi:hypothetical protein
VIFAENYANLTSAYHWKNGTVNYVDGIKPYNQFNVNRVEEWSDSSCDYIKSYDSLTALCNNGSEIVHPLDLSNFNYYYMNGNFYYSNSSNNSYPLYIEYLPDNTYRYLLSNGTYQLHNHSIEKYYYWNYYD